MPNFFDQFDQASAPAGGNFFDQFDDTQGVSLDVPTEANLAATARPPQQQQDRTIGETLIGAGETALTAVTGATSGAAGYIGGAIKGLVGEATGELETGEGRLEAEKLAGQFTYQPRTEAGKEFVSELAEATEFLPPVLGAGPSAIARGATLGKLTSKNVKEYTSGLIDSYTKEGTIKAAAKKAKGKITEPLLDAPRIDAEVKQNIIADEIKKGTANVDLVAKELNATGDVIKNKTAQKAVKAMGGKESAIATVAVLERMSPASKEGVDKMLNIIQRGRKNPIYGDTNRPSDVLGDSIASRAKTTASINKSAGKRIGNIANTLKNEQVDVSAPIDKFHKSLSDLGVKFTVGEDGFVTPDFSRSKFIGGNQKDMNVLINDLLDGNMGFEKAHKIKRTIRDNIDFDKLGTSQIKGESQKMLKDLSKGIDEVLDGRSKEYKKANEDFAKTVKLRDDFDRLTGKDIDLFGDLSGQALGGKARRLSSNAESRTRIQQTLIEVDKVLGEFGIKFKDDIPSLVHIVGKLEDEFKIAPGGSLQGQVAKASVNAITSTSATARLVDIAASKILELSQPSFDKKMLALKALTKQRKIKPKNK